MGLKDFFKKVEDKAGEATIGMTTSHSSAVLKLLDIAINKKIKDFQRKKLPLTVDNLMKGSKQLVTLVGIPEETIRERIEERLKALGASE